MPPSRTEKIEWGGCPLRPASYDVGGCPEGGATKEVIMAEVHVLAIDLAKRSFQVCGTARGGALLFGVQF
jgi:hypothetical protein